jgi:hypothetical protein
MAGHSMFTKGTGIALALLSFLILGAAFLQNIAAGVVVFITGMIMAPPFVSGLLVCVPVWWAQNARWPWRVAATLPAVSLGVAYAGLFAPELHVIPDWARSNMGPPALFGVWAWGALAYIGVLVSIFPRRQDGEPPVL